MDTNELSAKMRDYLVEIYRLSERTQNPYVSTSLLADLLNVTPPAVNRMVARLKEVDLLQHEPYQGIRLTENGKREALIHLRRHRIVEAFLVQVMRFQWHEVFEEAQQLSATLSDSLMQRMWDMAGQPHFCPHGEPIPSSDGTISALADRLMTEVNAGETVRITRVLTRDADRLMYLSALGLMPGTTIQILHLAPFNGPLQLKMKDEYRIIGHNLAELIRVIKDDS
ncbi:MAG: metal-dependent transcriptional regulator [Anaerolineae bacterium]|jgi:DtxR family Mn-dependent transcriptional regulator|nr:metal-dependent transcriptional regulator [Anaerolineae bacterium]